MVWSAIIPLVKLPSRYERVWTNSCHCRSTCSWVAPSEVSSFYAHVRARSLSGFELRAIFLPHSASPPRRYMASGGVLRRGARLIRANSSCMSWVLDDKVLSGLKAPSSFRLFRISIKRFRDSALYGSQSTRPAPDATTNTGGAAVRPFKGSPFSSGHARSERNPNRSQ
jgi:hypothetical protein